MRYFLLNEKALIYTDSDMSWYIEKKIDPGCKMHMTAWVKGILLGDKCREITTQEAFLYEL
jgi:hypothetical protein